MEVLEAFLRRSREEKEREGGLEVGEQRKGKGGTD